MKIYAPEYYKKFKCIADKCRHNCCIGWEIDVDYDTLELYSEIQGGFGKRLRENIDKSSNPPHFILSGNERCPFLNKNNLCDIILNLGEESLCQICADHPRFRSFFSDREEVGLGMCCEAAAELILNHRKCIKMVEISADGEDEIEDEIEDEYFSLRQKIFDALENKKESIDKRILNVFNISGICFLEKSFYEWAEIFKKLERLDEKWNEKLKILEAADGKLIKYNEKINIAFENLLKYFILRHTAEGIYDGRIKERICFCVLSFYIIRAIFSLTEDKSFENLVELCRMYSAEIEYSEENIEALLDVFDN